MKNILTKITSVIDGLSEEYIVTINKIFFFNLVLVAIINLFSCLTSFSIVNIIGVILNLGILIWIFMMNPISFKNAGLEEDFESVLNFGITVSALLSASFIITLILNLFTFNIINIFIQSILLFLYISYTRSLMGRK